MKWLLDLFTGIPQAAAGYFTRKMELRAEKEKRQQEFEDAMHKRRIELISQGLHADATWEIEQIKAAGWKDEWVISLLSIPLVMCFIPGLDQYVFRGFEALNQTPDWYQWLILLTFTAVFGIRIWRRQQSDT